MGVAWNKLKTVAQAEFNGWSWEAEPNQPTRPLLLRSPVNILWPAICVQPMPSHRLQVEELYQRGSDLIVRFSQSAEDAFGFQLDYRLIEAPGPFEIALELLISVQTTLLDSYPKFLVASQDPQFTDCSLSTSVDRSFYWQSWSHDQLSEDDLAFSAQSVDSSEFTASKRRAAILCQSQDFSGVWLIDPRDQGQLCWGRVGEVAERQQDLTASRSGSNSAELFGSFLEKGVIRRARLQLLATSHSVVLSDLQQAYGQLLHRDLPLTA